MKIKCPNCSAAYDMDESRVPSAGVNIKCPRCQNPFRVTKQGVVGATPPAAAPPPPSPAMASDGSEAVPLPAPDRSPARAAPPAGRPPGAIVPPPPMATSPNAATMAGLPPLDSEFSMPPGWDSTHHPGQRKTAPPMRSPLTTGGMGAPSAAPARAPSGFGSSDAATVMAANPFDLSGQPFGGGAPDPFSAPPAYGAPPAGDDAGFEVDFADPGSAQTVNMPNAGSFDFSSVQTVSSPHRDPALDAAMQMSHTPAPGADPYGYGAPNPFAAPPAGNYPPDAGTMLDFADDAAQGRAHGAPAISRWQVRRKSGKVFGPFEPAAIVAMLQQGQLFGNEEISPDGENWYPISAEPTFAAHLKTEAAPEPRMDAPALAPAGFGRVPPPVIPVMSTGTTGPNAVPAGTVPFEASLPPKAPRLGRRAVPVWVRLLMRRLPLLAVAAVVLLVLIGGIAVGKFTEYGYFGAKFLAGKRPGERTAATQSIEKFYQFASEGTFTGSQKALGAIQTAVTQDEESPEALMNFAVISCRLTRRYGSSTAKGEFEKAKGLVIKHVDRKLNEGKIAFAAIDLCEGGPKISDAKALLDPLSTNRKAEVLYGEVLLALKDYKAAAAHLDSVLKSNPSGEAAMLRAEAAHSANDAAGEEAALAKAQEIVPGHARARLWVARMRVAESKLPEAGAILKEILVDPVVRSLDASEEAMGHHFYGDVLVAQRQFADASKEYQRAADIEPENVKHRTSFAQLALRLRQWNEALPAFEKALEKAPGDVELLTGACIAYTQLSNFTKATQRIDDAKKKAPSDPAVLVASGELQVALQHPADAHKAYKDALAKDEKYVPALVSDARLFMKEGKLDDAKERIEKAIANAPQDPVAQAALGRYSLLANDPTKAKEAFAKAVELDVDNPDYHSGLADSLAVLDELAPSKASFEKAVTLDPKDTNLRQRFAQLLRRMNDLEGALKQVDAALAVDTKDARLQAIRGAVLLDLDRATEAETALKAALALKDDEAIAHDYYGRLLSALKNDTKNAVEHMKRAVEIDPKSADIRYQQGLVYERGQMLIDAVESFRAALRLDDKMIDAEEHLASSLMNQNLYPEAIQTYQKVIEKQPKRVTALASLADCHFKAGDVDEAIKYFKQALALDANMGNVQYKLGRAYDKKGQVSEAEKAYLAATKLDPKNAWPYYYLGYAYKGRGKRKEAVEMFRQYLKNNKDAKDIDEINDEIAFLSEGR